MDTLNQSTSTSIAWQPKHNVEVTPRGLKIMQVIGSTSIYFPDPQVNRSYSCNVWRFDLMHKKLGNKGYDQSVTCLADDSQNLGTRSNTLRTPGILSQANNNPHIKQILTMQLFEDWTNAIKLGSKEVWSKCYLPCWWSMKPRGS